MSSGEFGGEGIQWPGPEVPEPSQPLVDLLQGRGIDRIQAPGPLGPDRGEARLPQHSQVPRDSRLRDAELGDHHVGHLPGRPLAVLKELKDASADRVSEDIERMHTPNISVYAYISNG